VTWPLLCSRATASVTDNQHISVCETHSQHQQM